MTSFSLALNDHKSIEGDLQINAAPSDVFRVLPWGSEIMVKEAGLSTSLIKTSNFQAVGLYNKSNNTMGGVSNYLRIPHADFMKVARMQVEDDFKDKRTGWNNAYNMEAWRVQKMAWLGKDRGTIYFWWHHADAGDWYSMNYLEWGTVALGNNVVTVTDIEILKVKTPDGLTRTRRMARLAGFRRDDWGKPLAELVASGLVHRCYCAYMGDDLGDTPKGIVYSPFWSPEDWVFIGPSKVQIDAFYIPEDWLMPV